MIFRKKEQNLADSLTRWSCNVHLHRFSFFPTGCFFTLCINISQFWILCEQYLLWDVDDPRRLDQQVHDDRRLWLCPQELPAGMHVFISYRVFKILSSYLREESWQSEGVVYMQISGGPWLGLSNHLVGDRDLPRPWLLPVPQSQPWSEFVFWDLCLWSQHFYRSYISFTVL